MLRMHGTMRLSSRMAPLAAASFLLLGASHGADSISPGERITAIAVDYRDRVIHEDPLITYSTGLPPAENDRLADRSPAAIEAGYRWRSAELRKLQAIDGASLPRGAAAVRAVLIEQLSADLGLRVCRKELWDVNHFTGWQTALAAAAEGQPIASEPERRQALARWSSLPQFVDHEIANLNRGLSSGYSAPRSLVDRVVRQIDALAVADPAQSPLYSPALRSSDAAFKRDFSNVLATRTLPALRRYEAYLRTNYRLRARTSVALSDLPKGRDCYRAMLRANTTLDRTPEAVFALGQSTVEANLSAIRSIGQRRFGTAEVPEIIARLRADPSNRFGSKEELIDFTRSAVAAARAKSAAFVSALPKQDVVAKPERDADEAVGISSHYDVNGNAAEPAVYRIQTSVWKTQTRGEAMITAVHETWPGHHLQIALSRERQAASPLGELIINAAYVEGWARYAEGLAEEVGLYQGDDARVLRRVWPARGMVVDPGLHYFGWSRQRAVAYLMSTGRFDAKQADDMVDRIAAMPGQLTAYDTGALEIVRLRHRAEQALAARFDLRAFDDAVIQNGAVPLLWLRERMERWIAAGGMDVKAPQRRGKDEVPAAKSNPASPGVPALTAFR